MHRGLKTNVFIALSTLVLAVGCGSDSDPTADTTLGTTPSTVVESTTTSEPIDLEPRDPDPQFGEFNDDVIDRLLASGDDGAFFMVNLIDFRDNAQYADGRETELTGQEANNLYIATGVEILLEGGMRPAIHGTVDADPESPTEPAWEEVAIVRYPSPAEFVATTDSPAFTEGVEHKDAGVETTTVMVSHRIGDPPTGAELPAADAPVVLFEIFSHDGTGTDDTPTAVTGYLDGLARLGADHDAIALGTYNILGVLVGDGRTWDQAHVTWFADRADLEALQAEPEFAELLTARDAVLDDTYSLVVEGVVVEPLGRQP